MTEITVDLDKKELSINGNAITLEEKKIILEVLANQLDLIE